MGSKISVNSLITCVIPHSYPICEKNWGRYGSASQTLFFTFCHEDIPYSCLCLWSCDTEPAPFSLILIDKLMGDADLLILHVNVWPRKPYDFTTSAGWLSRSWLPALGNTRYKHCCHVQKGGDCLKTQKAILKVEDNTQFGTGGKNKVVSSSNSISCKNTKVENDNQSKLVFGQSGGAICTLFGVLYKGTPAVL